MKTKKWLKRIGIGFLVLVLLFIALIIFLVIKDLKSEQKLNKEVEEIQDIMDATEFDERAFKKKLNKTVTTGDYYKVERAYKNYLRDYLKINDSIIDFYDKLEIESLLTMDNIKADGKDFFKTRSILNSYTDQLDKLKASLDSMADEKKVISYLKGNASDYYKDYYKQIIGDIRQTESEKELSKYLEDSSTLLKNTKKAFDFLSEQQQHWVVEDDMILFDSEELLQQYQTILSEIIDFAKKSEPSTEENTQNEIQNTV